MLQQILALLVIFFFVIRLYFQKKNKSISANEFVFWLVFWTLAGAAVVFIKKLDELSGYLGFSSSGIDILLYIGVMVLVYLIFKLRLRMEKQEKNISKIIEEIALKSESDK